MSGAATYDADVKDFTERSEHDRHHVRFTIFPEDGLEMPERYGKGIIERSNASSQVQQTLMRCD